jgi:hypothetical protein
VARHNREGTGSDQRGFEYTVSYQPDWLRRVKVTRSLPSGRQSTKILFRNPSHRRAQRPGRRVRTLIACPEQGVNLEVVVHSPAGGVGRVVVACRVDGPDGAEEEISFTLEDGLLPAP